MAGIYVRMILGVFFFGNILIVYLSSITKILCCPMITVTENQAHLLLNIYHKHKVGENPSLAGSPPSY